MSGSSGGFLPSAQASQNLMNVILALGRLDESRKDREATLAKTQAEQAAKERERREKSFGNTVIGELGHPVTEPEIGLATGQARKMFESPHAYSVTAPVSGSTFTATPTGEGGTLPNILNRAPRSEDVRREVVSGGARLRADFGRRLEVMGVKPGTPEYDYAMTQWQTPLPSKATQYVADIETGRREPTKTAKDVEELTKLKRENVIGATLQPSAIAKGEAESISAVAKAKIDKANSEYAVSNAKADNALKLLDEQLKTAERDRQPDVAAKLKLDIEHAKLQNQINRNQIELYNNNLMLTDAYFKAGTDKEREVIAQRGAMLNGHSGALLSHDDAKQRMVMDLHDKAMDAEKTAYQLIKEGTPEAFSAAKDYINQATKWRVEAAIRNNSDTVMVTTAVPTDTGWIRNVPGLTTSTLKVPTGAARDYTTVHPLGGSVLEHKAYGPPDQTDPQGTQKAASALTYVARFKTSPNNDPAALARFIRDSPAPQATKDLALQNIATVINSTTAIPGATITAPTAAPAQTSLPTSVDRPQEATTRARIEAEGEAASKRETANRAMDEQRRTRERTEAIYLAQKAREAGLTSPMHASQAQLKQWKDEFYRTAGAKLRAIEAQ